MMILGVTTKVKNLMEFCDYKPQNFSKTEITQFREAQKSMWKAVEKPRCGVDKCGKQKR